MPDHLPQTTSVIIRIRHSQIKSMTEKR